MDTLHALRVAAVVHRTAGFSAAARELGVTPGAVAKLVAQLEARIGMRLFERSTRHVSPTRDALLLFERAEGPLRARPLATLYPVLCASPGYLAAHGSPSVLEDLERHRLIGLRSESTGRVRDWTLLVKGRSVSFRPSGTLQVTDPEALAAAAAEGCGIALVGFHHTAQPMSEGRLVRVLRELHGPRFQIVIYYARRRHQSARVQAFIDHVLASVPALPALRESQPARTRTRPSAAPASSTGRSRG